MSRQIGLDLSPFALRAFAREENGDAIAFSPVYSPKGCAASEEYASSDRWDDPFAFRTRTLDRRFEVNEVEQTAAYLKPDTSNTGWLDAYAQRIAAEAGGTYGAQLIATVPDHATPDEKDAVIRGLNGGGFGRPLLLWRPVAAALYWLQRQRDTDLLDGCRLVVLDLDGTAPEVTEFELARHKVDRHFIVPVRAQPKRHQILKSKGFHARCYQLVMNGFDESIQLIEGQFSAAVQAQLEQGANKLDTWVRRNAAWTRVSVGLATDLPRGSFSGLETILKNVSCGEKVRVICVGWLARRYADRAAEWLRARFDSEVEILPAEAISAGAARFGELLSRGLPTYYDKLPRYRWWDSRRAEWVELFSQYQRVEPGRDYIFPAEGDDPCRLSIDKFNDNVSMYVQVKTEDDRYEDDEVYAHRLKIHFVEFLRSRQIVTLSARVNPQEGSASFTITAQDRIFKMGNTRSQSATLRYSEDPDADRFTSVQIVHEHEGYLEPQPVLGRIYDNEQNLRMILASEDPLRRAEAVELCRQYLSRYPRYKDGRLVPIKNRLVSERVGYEATPHEPTRGLFGTKRIPDAVIDSASHRFAERVCQKHPWECGLDVDNSEAMKCNNYLHSWASDTYKKFIRTKLKEGWSPRRYAFNYCYAPGYVLGDEEDDLVTLLNFIVKKRDLGGGEKANLWWSVFRMLCWHEETLIAKVSSELLHESLRSLLKDACDVSVYDKKFLVLALLYLLRFREVRSHDLSESVRDALARALTNGVLGGVGYPRTMINNLNGVIAKDGDSLSLYVLRFLLKQDTLRDRELGAAMGGV